MSRSVGCISINEDSNLWFAVSLLLLPCRSCRSRLRLESWTVRLYGTWLRVRERSGNWSDSIGHVAGGASR
jgi:hypothetical protein